MAIAQGTISQRSEDSLSIIANYKDDSDHWRQKWQTVKRRPGETDKALRTRAEEELQALIVKLRSGQPVVTGRLTLSDYILKSWLPSRRSEAKPPTERTLNGYRYLLSHHVIPVIGNMQLSKIRPADVGKVYTAMKAKCRCHHSQTEHAREGSCSRKTCHCTAFVPLTDRTQLHVHRALSKAFADAVDDGKLASNPCKNKRVTPKAEDYEATPPTPEEVSRLIEAAKGTRIEALIPLLAFTGLRIGEALGLRWQDLDLTGERHVATVDGKRTPIPTLEVRQVRKQHESRDYGEPKTRKSRRDVVLIHVPAVVAILSNHWKEQFARYQDESLFDAQGLVFTVITRAGVVGMSHDDVNREWQRVRTRARVNVRLHDLRHFVATTLIDAGVPLTNISGILGHSKVTTTANVYAHAIEARNASALGVIEQALRPKAS